MKTYTIQIADDEVLVALKRVEAYDDVHPELVSEDAIGDRWPEYRTIHGAALVAVQSPQVAPDLRAAAQAVLDRWNSPKWEWLKHGPTADLMAALRTALDQYPKATYSIDLDPAGIRALVCDAITGALALGAQNESPAPEGHWLGHFWQLGRQHDEWRATVWAVARALNCLPSTFSDANGHVLRAAERLMAERSAIPAPAAGQPKE